MAKKQQRELLEQSALVQWFCAQYPDEILIVSANGGSRHPLEAANLKRSGVRRGIPDIFLPVPRGKYHGLWIEFKPSTIEGVRKATATKEQKEMISYLISRGYDAYICWGFEAAVETIRQYLAQEKRNG